MTLSKRGALAPFGAVVVLLLTATSQDAAPPAREHRRGRPNLDARSGRAVSERRDALAANPSAAVKALAASLGAHGIASIDGLTETPRIVARLDGFLTGPSGRTAARIALDYVRAHADVFKVDVSRLQLAREYVSVDGTRHVWWRQVINGIPVFGNGLKANVTADGRLINVIGSPLAGLGGAASSPALSADEALARTRLDAGVAVVPLASTKRNDARNTTEFATGETAALTVFRTPKGNRLAWDLLVEPTDQQMYRQVIDAQTGEVLYRLSLVNYANGNAFRNYPGAPAGGTAETFDMSGSGWLSPTAKILSGPNARVYSDQNANNFPDQTEEINREDPATGRNNWLWSLEPFSPAVAGCDSFVCSWDPDLPGSWAHNENQSGTQLFVHLNLFHDHLKAAPIGFTPAAGNFEGNDPVRGEAMDGAKTFHNMPDGAHIDNANMGTPPDGFRPRMQMFLWHFPGDPNDPFIAADGSNDVGIIYHEYTHGLSNRLVIDADGFSTLGSVQAGSMGEAWSDWYAYDFLEKQGLQPDEPGVGDVRVGHYVGAGQDLIRFEPIDCKIGQTAADGCPGGIGGSGPGGFDYGDFGKVFVVPEVHSDGEIWAQTLWDLRDALGSDTTESLVTRAMELSPFNPSFLDERNAILQADMVLHGGANQATIWSVFAHRGMGWFAGTIDGDDTRPVANFSMPPNPGDPKGSLTGSVTDLGAGGPIQGAIVAFGGHDHGAGDYVGTSNASGAYSIADIFAGTYPKVSARGPGYDPLVLATLTINAGANTKNWQLRRDWAALSGGGSIADFNGPDYTPFGCGPTGAIDQSQGNGWGSDTDHDALITGFATDKFIVVKLPVKVDVSELGVNPSNTCGDPGSSSTRGWRIDVSPDGTSFATLVDGVFYLANRGRMNTVFTGSATGVQYVRFWILNPQVPSAPGATSCTGPTTCGTDPDDDSGVALHCGTGKDNAFGGCVFMDMVELAVYGHASP
jgi:extracellular elastinolytic metalloproteinase